MVNYGDGTATKPLSLSGNNTFSLAHAYAAIGNYVVTVHVTDTTGLIGSGQFTVTVVQPSSGLGRVPDAFVATLDEVLGRYPEYAGLRYWARELKGHLRRPIIVKLFFSSPRRRSLVKQGVASRITHAHASWPRPTTPPVMHDYRKPESLAPPPPPSAPAIAADQVGVGLGPGVQPHAGQVYLVLLAAFFLRAAAHPRLPGRGRESPDRGQEGGACLVEASALLDDVRHLLAGVLAAGLAGVGRDKADFPHLRRPFLVVVAASRRDAEMVLPEMGAFRGPAWKACRRRAGGEVGGFRAISSVTSCGLSRLAKRSPEK